MIRRLTSAPKPAARVPPVHVDQVARARHAQAVPHAVVAREVRRRLGGGDQVVGGQPVLGVRQRDRLRRSRRASRSASMAARTAALDLGVHALDEVLARARRAAARSTPRRERGRGSRAPARPRAVESRGSCAGDGAEHERRVRHVLGERADLVERGGERDQAVARHAPVGRLEPDDAAERGGLADRAAGVGAEGRRRPGRPPPPPPSRRTSRPARAPRSQGFRVGKNAEFSVEEPIANSSMLSLPSSTAPAAREPRAPRWRRTAARTARGCASRRWWRCPRVQSMSLTATGTPSSGPRGAPAREARVRRGRLRRGPGLARHREVRAHAAGRRRRCARGSRPPPGSAWPRPAEARPELVRW